MDGISLSFSNAAQAFTQFIKSPVSRITSLGTGTIAGLGLYFCSGLYIAYNFYHGYRCNQVTSLNLDDNRLDDRFKLLRAEYLLQKIKGMKENPIEDKKPLLVKAEQLISSIKTDDIFDRNNANNALFELSMIYAETDPEKSLQLASQLTSKNSLCQAALMLHEKLPKVEISKLLEKARMIHLVYISDMTLKLLQKACEINLAFVNDKKPQHFIFKNNIEDVNFYLDLAAVYEKLKDDTRSSCLEDARTLNNSFTDPLRKLAGLCNICVFVHKKTPNLQDDLSFTTALSAAKAMLKGENPEVPKKHLVLGHLMLAKTLHTLENSSKMKNELQSAPILEFQNLNNIPFSPEEMAILERVVTEISFKGAVLPGFEAFANALTQRLDITLQNCKEQESALPEYILRIAKAYSDLGNKEKAKEAAQYAFKRVQDLETVLKADDTPYSLGGALYRIIYYCNDGTPESFRPMLEMLKDLCTKSMSNSEFLEDASIWLFAAYKQTNLQDEAAEYFKQYLSNISTPGPKEGVFDVIDRLVNTLPSMYLTKDQRMACLNKACELLSQESSNITKTQYIRMIAEGYLKVDPEQSNRLIDYYETTQLKTKLTTEKQAYYTRGVVGTALVASLYFYPPVLPFIALCGSFLHERISKARRHEVG